MTFDSIVDQVATAPCTDPVQVRFLTPTVTSRKHSWTQSEPPRGSGWVRSLIRLEVVCQTCHPRVNKSSSVT